MSGKGHVRVMSGAGERRRQDKAGVTSEGRKQAGKAGCWLLAASWLRLLAGARCNGCWLLAMLQIGWLAAAAAARLLADGL